MPTSSGLFLIALHLLGSGSRVDVAAGAGLQVRAGLLPEPNQTNVTEPSLETTLAPSVGVQLRSPRTTTKLTYDPRFSLRFPAVIEPNRPLIFHRVAGSYFTALTKRLRLSFNANAGAGELNYGDLDLIFDPGTGVSTEQIIPLVNLSGATSVTYSVSARDNTSISVRGGYRTPLEESTTIPTTGDFSGSLSHQHLFDTRQSISGGVSAGRIAGDGRETTTLSGSATYANRLGELASFSLTGAANYARQGAPQRTSQFFPSGNASYQTGWRDPSSVWSMSTSGGVSAFYDQFNAEYRPQLGLSWSVLRQSVSDWTAGLNFLLSLPLSDPPSNPDSLQSVLSLTAPITVPLGKGFRFQCGASIRLRGPHPSALADGLIQTEATANAGITYRIGTGTSRGSWL